MNTSSIEAKVFFHAKPSEVYDLLMNEKKLAAITEGEVRVSDRPDGRFEVFGGYCHGYNIELIEGVRIVQAWHFDEDDWPRNHYSICIFDLKAEEGGCIMHFQQSEIPESSAEKLKSGWQTYYWEPMQAYFLA